MDRYPDSTKASLEQRLRARARERWPQIASLQIRHRGVFSYVDATLTDATTFKLCRLRYVGSASQWQFAIYRASHDDYDESVFFTGLPVGTCQDALDTACGLYLNDPTAWIRPPTNLRGRPLSKSRKRSPWGMAALSKTPRAGRPDLAPGGVAARLASPNLDPASTCPDSEPTRNPEQTSNPGLLPLQSLTAAEESEAALDLPGGAATGHASISTEPARDRS